MSYNFLMDVYCVNEDRTRQTGKTTVLLEACKKIGGIFVAHSYEQGQVLKRKNPDVNITYPSIIKLRGQNKPIIFDHYLLSLMFSSRYASIMKIITTRELEKKLQSIKEELLKRYTEEIYIGVNVETQDF